MLGDEGDGALQHQQPDFVPVDFGATSVTGMHASCVAALRDYYGLERRMVRIFEPGQMLGWMDDDLKQVLGIDVEPVFPRKANYGLILKDWNYTLAPRAKKVFLSYIEHRRTQPHFANARSIRNALDRARLRQARRLLDEGTAVDKAALETIEAEDILESRVLAGVPAATPPKKERA